MRASESPVAELSSGLQSTPHFFATWKNTAVFSMPFTRGSSSIIIAGHTPSRGLSALDARGFRFRDGVRHGAARVDVGAPGVHRRGSFERSRVAPRGRGDDRERRRGLRAADQLHDVRARGVRARRASARHRAPRAAGRALRRVAPREARRGGRGEGGGEGGEGGGGEGGERERRRGEDAPAGKDYRTPAELETRPAVARGHTPAPAGVEAGRPARARGPPEGGAKKAAENEAPAEGATTKPTPPKPSRPTKVVPFVQLDLNPDMDDESDDFEEVSGSDHSDSDS